MITFDVNDKARKSPGEKLLPYIDDLNFQFNLRTKSNVEACGATSSRVLNNIFSHPFLEAAHTAYDKHYPLALSPDSVWLCIAQGFASHINLNAESLRSKFVSHSGKKMIRIDRDAFIKGSPNNDWQGCFNEFSDKLEEHIGKKRDLVVSNFSTTGLIEKASSEIVLMDSMKAYFKYAVRTCCGIPSVMLTGSVDDWKNIRTRVENLAEYDLGWWVKSLVTTTDHLVKAAEGNPDIKFWDSLYKNNGGSGGPYIGGWVNTLFPYIEDYKGNLRKNSYAENWDSRNGLGGNTLDSFPQGLSKVDFKWQVYDTTHDMEFLGGMVGVSQDEKTLALTPSIGWAVRDKGTSRPGPIDEKEDW